MGYDGIFHEIQPTIARLGSPGITVPSWKLPRAAAQGRVDEAQELHELRMDGGCVARYC